MTSAAAAPSLPSVTYVSWLYACIIVLRPVAQRMRLLGVA
jgi:hypothetical protein